ncbi:unnamed protein product [Medioppia subpectinata]|uniref:CUB domain-containing protein n=1 Tax=Medioppia subpectinata TaxID=1979941 RepID=A0A7R9KVY2_9ACAR|nr:unnamed protein product [Medioppia subpectinata]CAG2110476.1 unnamed protein product [Medioppia subpectinata]
MFYFSSDDNHEERGYEIRITQIPKSCFNNHNYGFAVKPSFITSTPTPYLTTSYTTVNNTYYTCDEIISSEIHVITSPNYPQNYPAITRCVYTFLKSMANVCQMRIKILDMDLEHTRHCVSDYLVIESTGERFCGQFLQQEDKIINFPSFSRELRLIFNSDRQTTRTGFRLRAEQIPDSCTHPVIDHRIGDTIGKPIVEQIPLDPVIVGKPINPVITKNVGTYPANNAIKPLPQICSSSSTIVSTFVSDNYPLPYNAYTNCVYKVKGERIVVDFGTEKQEINIRFHTESAVRYGGFKIQARQLDNNCDHHNSIPHEFSPGSTESCSKMHFSEKSLQILSPHYDSGSYQPFLDCEYTVRKSTSDICALEVKFDAFALEESKACYKDYLQIGEMRLCGKLPFAATRTYEFKSDEIAIKFHTDANGSDAGFVIMVKQIQC